MKAILLSAGYGKRLRPFTWFWPKQFIKIQGKSVIERNIEYLNSYGITDIMLNANKKTFPQFRKKLGSKVSYFYESTPYGEEFTLNALKGWIDQPTVVMNSDTLTKLNLNKLIFEFNQNKNERIMAFDGKKYTGIMIVPSHNKDSIWSATYRYNGVWVDCGTWKGVLKAQKIKW